MTGRSQEQGGAGDPSVYTAWGVIQGMRAAAEHVWGTSSLAGRRVGIAGLGKVGRHLTGHLLADGASVIATDISPAAREWARATHPEMTLVEDIDALIKSDIDIYAPCALGGALNDETVPMLRARVVAGSANNQLAHPGIDQALVDRGILYVPDYLINAGGLIQVADEIRGFDPRAGEGAGRTNLRRHARAVDVLQAEGVPPGGRGRPASGATDS